MYAIRSYYDEYKPIIITDSFKTPANIGNILRLGTNIGACKIITIENITLKDRKIRKTAGAAFDHIPLITTDLANFQSFIPSDYTLTALETCTGAQNIFQCQLPSKMALVLGNEIRGISPELLTLCQSAIYIPMPGSVKSMNVSHAAAVALFQWLNQHLKSIL